MPRAQIIFDADDFQAFRAAAKRQGLSLSAWLRLAARERLIREEEESPTLLQNIEDLDAFFSQCDQKELHPEPDWDEHQRTLEYSRGLGIQSR